MALQIKNRRGWIASIVFLLGYLAIKFISPSDSEDKYQFDKGEIYKTTYSIIYQSPTNHKIAIETLLNSYGASISPFDSTTQISKINQGDTTVVADGYLKELIVKSKEIYEKTDGAFDPTISPLINAWGFGYKNSIDIEPCVIDSLLQYVGINRVTINADGVVKRESPNISLNFSAIAKGRAVDLVAEFLNSNNIDNFLVEIGGEIVSKGINPKGDKWHIGVDKPAIDNDTRELEEILRANSMAMATSGNYRKFRYVDGKRVGHTINPKTGRPTNNSLLSATVIAPNCMTADAYATAFMVLGLNKSQEILAADTTLQAILIYAADSTQNSIYITEGVKSYISDGATDRANNN